MATKINYGITGIGGDFYGPVITYSIAANGNQVIPQGYYYILPDANGTIQINLSGTWTSVAPAGTGGMYFSDGATIRVLAGSTASTTKAVRILFE